MVGGEEVSDNDDSISTDDSEGDVGEEKGEEGTEVALFHAMRDIQSRMSCRVRTATVEE
jgi:hypothetical protein